jgi:hypothetical protein
MRVQHVYIRSQMSTGLHDMHGNRFVALLASMAHHAGFRVCTEREKTLVQKWRPTSNHGATITTEHTPSTVSHKYDGERMVDSWRTMLDGKEHVRNMISRNTQIRIFRI